MGVLSDFSRQGPMIPSNWERSYTMTTFCKRLWQDTEGQDLVEYALMVGMVAVAAVAAMPSLTNTLSTVFSKIGSTVTAQVP
jgi:pilus assembly protein Flp/PilA